MIQKEYWCLIWNMNMQSASSIWSNLLNYYQITSKLFVIASSEANVYGSSYYWNFRTSSFKQVACLILQKWKSIDSCLKYFFRKFFLCQQYKLFFFIAIYFFYFISNNNCQLLSINIVSFIFFFIIENPSRHFVYITKKVVRWTSSIEK